MSCNRQEPYGYPVSQGNFSQVRQQQSALGPALSQQQQVKWRKPWVWGLRVLVLLVGLSGGVFMGVGKAQASSSPQTQTTTQTFPVGAQPDLSITDTDAGFIHVHTGSSNTVVITTTIESTTGTLPTVNYATPDSNHIIVTITDNAPKTNSENLNKVDFDVTVPASSNLDLSTSAGDITIVGSIQGIVNLQSGAGNISLSNITLIGSGSIKASAGKITFAGSVVQGAAYQFQAGTGGLDVTLPSNTNCHVDARTIAGSIRSDFTEIHIHSTSITGQEGEGDIGSINPSATISLEINVGSVTIHKGNAA